MVKSLYWRIIVYGGISVFAILLLLPNFASELPSWFTSAIPTEKIRLGLDLQGGMYLLLQVEEEKAVESYVEQIRSNLADALKEQGVPIGRIERERDAIFLDVSGEKEKVDTVLSRRFPMLHEKTSSGEGGVWKYQLVLDGKDVENAKRRAVEQGLEIIRNRIDQFGVTEPEITRQGTNQILLQLPGIREPERAINLIGKTALLEFKLVDEEGNLEDALKGYIPPGDTILYERVVDPQTGAERKIPYLLKERTLMTGDVIRDARVAINQYNEPYVTMEFNDIGARLFEQITGANVRKRLAIILDNNVYSAPVIQERIAGGRAQITGHFDTKEASDLAIVLRSGSLPAPVKIVEQRTVGPSVGEFLGIGERLVAVSFRSLKMSKAGPVVYDVSKEQLRNYPKFSYRREGMYGEPYEPAPFFGMEYRPPPYVSLPPRMRCMGESMPSAWEYYPERLRVSALLDQSILNNASQEIADLDDLMIGPEGRTEQIILDVGGFLGLGRKRVAVPFRPLKITDRGIVYNITKEQLLKSSTFRYGEK